LGGESDEARGDCGYEASSPRLTVCVLVEFLHAQFELVANASSYSHRLQRGLRFNLDCDPSGESGRCSQTFVSSVVFDFHVCMLPKMLVVHIKSEYNLLLMFE